MSSIYKWIRFFAYTLEILSFSIVEQIPNLIPSVNNVKPIILLPIAIMIALFEGQKVGLVFGFIVGLFIDIGATGTIGFNTAAMTCLGFLVGNTAQKIIKFNLITSVAFVIAFTAAFYMLHFVFKFLLQGYSDVVYTFFNHYIIGMLYTVAISPFVYFFNKALAVNIKDREQ